MAHSRLSQKTKSAKETVRCSSAVRFRGHRFQAARFSSWILAGDPYRYRVGWRGHSNKLPSRNPIQHIASFISRALGDAPVPANITWLLENWQGGVGAAASR